MSLNRSVVRHRVTRLLERQTRPLVGFGHVVPLLSNQFPVRSTRLVPNQVTLRALLYLRDTQESKEEIET